MPAARKQKPSILVIGHLLDSDVECIGWDAAEPNVADYDIVIMDLTTAQKIQLPPPGAYSLQPRFQVDMSKYLQWSNIQRSVEKLLLSEGKLFVIAKPEIAVHPDSPRRQVHNLQSSSLLPFVFFGEQVSGQTVTWVDSRFNFYFQQVRDWQFVLNGHFLENFSEQVMCQVDSLAKNRVGEMIALSVSVRGVRLKVPGVIYLLPSPSEIETSATVELILSHLDDVESFPQQHIKRTQSRQEQVSTTLEADVASEKPDSSRDLSQKFLTQEKKMAGIPSHLSNPLRDALADCEQFEANRALRNVFTDERLRLWRNRLPQSDTLMGRADAVIDFLHDKQRRDGANALVLLLRVLSEKVDPEEELHDRLTTLADELEHTFRGGVSSPSQPSPASGPTKSEPVPPAPRSAATQTKPALSGDDSSATAPSTNQEEQSRSKSKDFFVSYNRHDKQWAEWIAWQLEAAGYTTVIQAWDFRPGGNFVADMQRATVEAERTIAVLSPDYLASNFTRPEWNAAFARDPTGKEGLLLPIRVRECELEGLLPQIVYIDLVGLDQAVAKRELLDGVKRGRAKPTIEPGFPGAVPHPPSEQPEFPGEPSNV